jgi:hypothetical protein
VDEQKVAAASGAGSPRQKGERCGARGRRQRRGGRAVEDPQATRGLAQWLGVELGHCAGEGRREQKQSREEARMTEEEESRQESEGPICKLKNFQGLLCKERFPR